MVINEALLAFIKEAIQYGKSREVIFQELLTKGWKLEKINEAFTYIETDNNETFSTNIKNPPVIEKEPDKIIVSSEVEENTDHTKAVRIIITAGAILVGLGVYTFLASNWQELSRPLRIAIILISIMLPYAVGWYLKEVSKLVKIGNGLILLGTIIYGVAIFLIAEMYHITGHIADGFALWMVGAIIMGLVTKLYQLYYVALLLAVISISVYVPYIFRNPRHIPALLISTLLLIISTTLVTYTAMKIRSRVPSEIVDKF
ncbi:MAG TPA: DUF2157 domain-containing protein [bacterium]|nr:DUF2157 domain-containing protein [bacterium]